MDLLAALYPLINGFAPALWIAIATWSSTRFGARATMMIYIPVQMFAAQILQLHMFGAAQVQTNALNSLYSLPMVYTWVLCWLVVAPPIERWMRDPPGSHRSAWVTSVASVLVSWALNVWVLRPLLAQVPQTPMARLPVITGFAVVGGAVAWWAQRGEAPARADGSLSNVLLRYLSILLLVNLQERLHAAEALPTLQSVLGSFPRLTFEMVVAIQAAHGVKAGKQVVVGLPLGLLMPVGWCLLVIGLADRVSPAALWSMTTVWALASLGLGLWAMRRLQKPPVPGG